MQLKKISKCLIAVGIILILIPIIGQVYMQHKQNQLYDNYLQALTMKEQAPKIVDPPDTDSNLENLKETQIQVPAQKEVKKGEKRIDVGEVIGKIEIPKADIDLIMLEGCSDNQLKMGAGHMLDTAYPGETGNCVIAGHRNYIFGSMFNRLDEVEVGDEVKIEFEGEEYTYSIENKKVVEPDEVSVLKQNTEGEKLTLITCHPVYTGTHRLIIEGELLK